MKYEDFETNWLDRINEKISPYCEMSLEEREFVNGLIRYHKPKKILEIGVSAGGSSAILLNAAADYGAEVHSVDYLAHWYSDPSKESGFLVKEQFPELAEKWHFHHGSIAAKFMEKIGGDIDFCLIDTMHCNPGEFLDFLMVLPYLKSEAIVVLHDVSLNTQVGKFDHVFKRIESYDRATTCNTLFSVLRGQRQLPSRKPLDQRFANIGAVKLASEIKQDPWPFFNLLTLPWVDWYYLKKEEWDFLRKFIAEHYSPDMQSFFREIVDYKNMRQTFKISKDFSQKRHVLKLGYGKVLTNFIKSYFLFPWYVYKTYDGLKSIRRNLIADASTPDESSEPQKILDVEHYFRIFGQNSNTPSIKTDENIYLSESMVFSSAEKFPLQLLKFPGEKNEINSRHHDDYEETLESKELGQLFDDYGSDKNNMHFYFNGNIMQNIV